MRSILTIPVLLLSLSLSVSAQRDLSGSVSVTFSIDGKESSCDDFHAELSLNGRTIKTKHSGQHFDVPKVFQRPPREWPDSQRANIALTCNGHVFLFRAHPAFVEAGSIWHLGIANPLYAIENYEYTHEFDRGAWLGYLIFEGEPGVVTFESEPDPLTGRIADFLTEQPNAKGERARNIAYELAILHVDYEKNRDYLLSLLDRCVSQPKESPEDATCNSTLMSFITNLYWRGDDSLLPILLRMPNVQNDVVSDLGRFYSELLDLRSKIIFDQLSELPNEQQVLVCHLANEGDLNFDSQRLERVRTFLQDQHTAAADRCLTALNPSD